MFVLKGESYENQDFTELTTPMIHEFVDKIVVHEADKSTGDKIQQIDIYLKYVGKSVNRRNKRQKKKSYLRQSARLSQK